MALTNNGTAFLNEFKDFIAFLKKLWGILAGVSVIYPLSNILIKAIPLQKWQGQAGTGALYNFSPSLSDTNQVSDRNLVCLNPNNV